MANSSALQYFLLTGFVDVGALSPFFFVCVLCLYVFIMCLNSFLVSVITLNHTLHRPMFLFLLSLFVNEFYGSAAIYPFILTHILRSVHTISTATCFLQIFCQYTYGTVEFGTLAAMSYDRYLAICCPLQYATRMSASKVLLLIVLVWTHAFVRCAITITLTLRLTFCGNVLDGVYCRIYPILKLACSDTTVNNVYGLVGIIVTAVFPLAAISLSYIKILSVCYTGSSHTRSKALNTCLPHILSVLNFCFCCSFDIISSRFDVKVLPIATRVFMTVYYSMFQPLVTPMLYGLSMREIRRTSVGMLLKKKKNVL